MLNELLIYVSLIGVGALVVFLIVCVVRQRKLAIRNPQPVRIEFKDPFGLASEFNYAINPNQRWKGSSGNMVFITETGQETPPEHREFEVEDAKQGDTLFVRWKMRDGSDVTGTTVLPTSRAWLLTVTLTKTRTVTFE